MLLTRAYPYLEACQVLLYTFIHHLNIFTSLMSELRVEQWIIFAFPAPVLTPHGGKKAEDWGEHILMCLFVCVSFIMAWSYFTSLITIVLFLCTLGSTSAYVLWSGLITRRNYTLQNEFRNMRACLLILQAPGKRFNILSLFITSLRTATHASCRYRWFPNMLSWAFDEETSNKQNKQCLTK